MMRAALLIGFLLLPSLASAGEYVWRNGVRYWYSCGRYTRSAYQHAPAVVAAPTQSASQAIAALAGKKAEWQFITESISTIFGTPSGGSSYQASGYVQQGNTVYGTQQGYSVQTVSATNSVPMNLEAQMERLSRMYAQAQDAAKPIADGVVSATAQQIAGNNVALQTLAQAMREQAALQSLQPIQPQDTKVETQYHASASTSTDPAQPATASATVTTQVVPDAYADAQAVLNNRCTSCHAGDQAPKGVDLSSDVRQFSQDKWALVLKAVTNRDESHRMPLGPNNTPGKPLGYDELGALVKAWGGK